MTSSDVLHCVVGFEKVVFEITTCFVLCCVGLEMDTPNPAPAKKAPTAPQLGDKYNIKPPVLKRPRYSLLLMSESTASSCGAIVKLSRCCPHMVDCGVYNCPFYVHFPSAALVHQMLHLWRKNTNPSTRLQTLPKRSKWKSFQHSVSLKHVPQMLKHV